MHLAGPGVDGYARLLAVDRQPVFAVADSPVPALMQAVLDAAADRSEPDLVAARCNARVADLLAGLLALRPPDD